MATTSLKKTLEEEEEETGYTYAPYQESEAVTTAKNLLNQQLSNKPGEYTSQWQEQINSILNQIMNRESFSYDLNGDALYNQYKNQAATQGKLASMDVMGQAAALTGGYGNSYAQSVGQQTYQGYLQQLNDKIPELYQLALDQYNQEGSNLYNKYSLLADQESQDYGKYRDQYSDWQSMLDYYSNRYDSERNYDYTKYSDDRTLDYTQYRDTIADEQWQKEFDEAVRQFNESNSGGTTVIYRTIDEDGKGSDTQGETSKKYPNPGYSKEQIKSIQEQIGITADGVWGDKTAAAYANGVRPKEKATGSTGTKTYNDVVKSLDTNISRGATDDEIKTLLVNARQAGYITQAQYNKLYKSYVRR